MEIIRFVGGNLKKMNLLCIASLIQERVQVLCGVLIYSFGVYLTIAANIGLAPWDCLGMGIANCTPLSYGSAMVLIALVAISLQLLMKERIGFATVVDALLTGNLVQLFSDLSPLPEIHNIWLGILIMLTGFVVIDIGAWLYIAAGQKHIDIAIKDLLIHRRSDAVKPISQGGLRRNAIRDTQCDFVEFLVLVKLVDILKVRLSKRQQPDHGQENIAVFDLGLGALFCPHTVRFFDQIRFAEHLSHERQSARCNQSFIRRRTPYVMHPGGSNSMISGTSLYRQAGQLRRYREKSSASLAESGMR